MKRILLSLCTALFFLSSLAAAEEFSCDSALSPGNQQFLDRLIKKTVLFNFADGDIHNLKIKVNESEVYTGTYGDGFDTYYLDMEIYGCRGTSGTEYILAYKDRKAPDGGLYDHEVYVMIPQSDSLFANIIIPSFVDLRWGVWYDVTVQVRQ